MSRNPVNTTSYDSTTQQQTQVGDLLTLVDKTIEADAGVTTPTYAAMVNYGNVKIRRLTGKRSVFFNPTTFVAGYTGAGTIAPQYPKTKQWIQTKEDTSGTTPQYGLFTGVDNPGTLPLALGVYITYYVQFKSRKL